MDEKKKENQYNGNQWKNINISLNDVVHAQFLAKLFADKLRQKFFFRLLVKSYLEDNPLMRELIKDLNRYKIKQKNIKKMEKQEKIQKKIDDLFALDENDIEDIYDQIENTEEEPNEF
jgi:hypothetical protein